MGDKFASAHEMAQIATPANPDPGYTKVYPKSDGRLYVKSGGTEAAVGPGVLDYAVWTNGGTDASVPLSNAQTPVTINSALRVSGTVPPSGAVVVTMSASVDASIEGYWWALVNVTGGAVVNLTGMQGSGSGAALCTTRQAIVTGLTPGASFAWEWRHAGNEDGTSFLYVGPGALDPQNWYSPMTIVATAL